MAKSTFLQFCQATRRACGLPGSGPTTVTGQVLQMEKVIEYVALADAEIQGKWFDWDFLHVSTWSSSTVINEPSVTAPTTIGVWDEDSFYLDYSTSNYKKLPVLPHKDWRANYRQGVKVAQQPSHIVIMPDLSLILEPKPDAVYSLTADYWKRPVKMTADSDTSLIPEEYERIIVARAKVMYGEDIAAADLIISGQNEYDDLLDKLEAKYLPGQSRVRRSSDTGMITVRPE